MVTIHGTECAARCLGLLAGRRDQAGVVWDALAIDDKYKLILDATHSRARARESIYAAWAEIPKALKVKMRTALARQIERAEAFAAALDRVQ